VDTSELGECVRKRDPIDVEVDDTLDPDLAAVFVEVPEEVRRIAEAAQIRRPIAELVRARSQQTAAAPLALQLQLVTRLSVLEIEASALLFEAQCVGNQMESTLRELDALQRRHEVALAVASIVVGAAAATAGSVWDLRVEGSNAPAIVGVSGGAASATLGLAAFLPARRPVVFPHPRNLLTPILHGEDPDRIYPRFIFRLVATPEIDGSASPRDEILEDWEQLLSELPPGKRATAEAVLFGRGGLYDAELIDIRERMFDVLESHLNALDHDLELLYRYTSRLVEVSPTSPDEPMEAP